MLLWGQSVKEGGACCFKHVVCKGSCEAGVECGGDGQGSTCARLGQQGREVLGEVAHSLREMEGVGQVSAHVFS